jgi:hypothetical protein
MAPSIAAGTLTFGLFQQISNAFDRVEDSFRFLANSWTTIISLISVYKRLRSFEAHIPPNAISGVDYDDPRYLESWDEELARPATEEVSGTVTSIDYSGDEPAFRVGDRSIGISQVTSITARELRPDDDSVPEPPPAPAQ